MFFKCAHCRLVFNHRQSLRRHTKDAHPNEPNPPSNRNLICNVCSANFKSKHEFIDHLLLVHDLFVVTETLNFDSLDEFSSWRIKVERETCAFYPKIRGTEINKNNSQRMTFVCSRSGHYSPEGKGIRHLKSQGTKKVVGYCPSQISLKVESDGECIATFVKTHWGHEQELSHISLTAAERASIANKIASKVPLSDILYGVRESVSNPNKIKRLEFLTGEDLHNIATSFKLKSEHQCDCSFTVDDEAGRSDSEYMKHQSDRTLIDDEADRDSKEKENLLTQVSSGSQNNALASAKSRLVTSLKNLITEVENSTNMEDISDVQILVDSSLQIMLAVRESSVANIQAARQIP